ncbi:MAG: hypothetical protein COB60_06880 [Flavobacteriaceae bacterium]|nr:MAG: hypothetical protein COB60_06880 [Flavobacteriaceae bacterium]
MKVYVRRTPSISLINYFFMSTTEKKSNKVILIVLAIFLVGALGYIFYSNQEHTKLTNAITEEKVEIQEDLQKMVLKYDEAIAQNTEITDELRTERDKIVTFQASIKKLKNSNYGLMRKYRKQIANMQASYDRLSLQVVELTEENSMLTDSLGVANTQILQKTFQNDSLVAQNNELLNTVTKGSVLRVIGINVISMRERSNGQLKETTRARRTDAFRINFRVAQNDIAGLGERIALIQILDSKGAVIAEKGTVTFDDGNEVGYSDRTIIDYNNTNIDVISLVELDRSTIVKGSYTVNVYLDNRFVGASNITLK